MIQEKLNGDGTNGDAKKQVFKTKKVNLKKRQETTHLRQAYSSGLGAQDCFQGRGGQMIWHHVLRSNLWIYDAFCVRDLAVNKF